MVNKGRCREVTAFFVFMRACVRVLMCSCVRVLMCSFAWVFANCATMHFACTFLIYKNKISIKSQFSPLSTTKEWRGAGGEVGFWFMCSCVHVLMCSCVQMRVNWACPEVTIFAVKRRKFSTSGCSCVVVRR